MATGLPEKYTNFTTMIGGPIGHSPPVPIGDGEYLAMMGATAGFRGFATTPYGSATNSGFAYRGVEPPQYFVQAFGAPDAAAEYAMAVQQARMLQLGAQVQNQAQNQANYLAGMTNLMGRGMAATNGGTGSTGFMMTPGIIVSGGAAGTSVMPLQPPKASTDLDAVTELLPEMVDDYGAAEMRRSAVLSDKLLALIGQDTAGEFSDKLNNLVLIAKGLDPAEAEKQRHWWRRFLNFLGVKAETVAAHYRMLDTQISTLAGELKVHSDRQLGRKRDLEALYGENEGSYEEIESLVKRGRGFLARVKEAPMAEVKSGMEAQRIADRQALAQRLNKRVTDLDVAMTLMLQTAPEIRIMQANAQALIDKFTTLVNLTIPAWKKQFALHVLQLEQKRSATVADAVDDATNDAFKKNADMLHDNTLQVAASGQRQIMDLSTIEHVQGEILRTVNDVRQLNAAASASRAEIAGKLTHIRDDLVASVAGQHVGQIAGNTAQALPSQNYVVNTNIKTGA